MSAEPVVCCVKVGDKYGPEYVNRLAAMVRGHTDVPHRFLCLTDNPRGITVPYTDIGTDAPGWWAKLVLFRPHPALDKNRVVYLDLDTVIAGDIGFLFAYEGPFAILRNFMHPTLYGSAIMSIQPGWGRSLWQAFQRDAKAIMARLHGDQEWIDENVTQADRWQDLAPGKIGSYKVDELHEGPKDFSICCFHGVPRPHEVDGWIREHWKE
jgi:hypothetical protein